MRSLALVLAIIAILLAVTGGLIVVPACDPRAALPWLQCGTTP